MVLMNITFDLLLISIAFLDETQSFFFFFFVLI